MSVAAANPGRPWRGVAAVLLLIVSMGQGPGAFAAGVPADWIAVPVGQAFKLMAPPGTAFHPAEGTDSIAGTIEGADFTLALDFGAYSHPLTDMSGAQNFSDRRVLIDGKAAHIVTAYTPGLSADRPFFIGLHVPVIAKTVVGTTKLTVYGMVATAETAAVVEAMFETIRFK